MVADDTLLGVTYQKFIQPAKPTKRKRRTEASLCRSRKITLYKSLLQEFRSLKKNKHNTRPPPHVHMSPYKL
jgi:hypothetical protein